MADRAANRELSLPTLWQETDLYFPHCLSILILQWWYNGGMKAKTSITLSKELLTALDRLAGTKGSRSALIERVLRKYLRERARSTQHARDLDHINRAAVKLNKESAEVLECQASEQ
jgi:predicted transcriptional regulator